MSVCVDWKDAHGGSSKFAQRSLESGAWAESGSGQKAKPRNAVSILQLVKCPLQVAGTPLHAEFLLTGILRTQFYRAIGMVLNSVALVLRSAGLA